MNDSMLMFTVVLAHAAFLFHIDFTVLQNSYDRRQIAFLFSQLQNKVMSKKCIFM